jgi:hypothetical protein
MNRRHFAVDDVNGFLGVGFELLNEWNHCRRPSTYHQMPFIPTNSQHGGALLRPAMSGIRAEGRGAGRNGLDNGGHTAGSAVMRRMMGEVTHPTDGRALSWVPRFRSWGDHGGPLIGGLFDRQAGVGDVADVAERPLPM